MTEPKHLKIAIIGAGAAGLAAAWDCVRQGHAVTIYEASTQIGGLASGFQDEGWEWTLEKFYHHWFETDHDILALAEELGLRDQIMFPRPKTSYWIDGKIVRSEISPSALFLPLPPLAKLRFALAGAFIKLTPDWRALEGITAHEWLLKYMGRAGYDKFFRPLLIGKFGETYQEVNMAWLWARVHARSLRLGLFSGGFQAFMDAFGAKLRAMGVRIALDTRVDQIAIENQRPLLTIAGKTHAFDVVITTTSPALLLRMIPALRDTAYGQQVGALKSIGALCVVLALKQQLLTDGTYWLNLPATSPNKQASQFPFLALVEHTNWIDRAHYGGDHLIYCGDYVPADHEYFQLDESQLAERFIAVLPTFNPAFTPDWVRKFWVFRAPYAQPVPGVGHSQQIPALATPLPGVYWASMSQVYPWDRGTNYAVELGRRTARLALENERLSARL